MKKMRIVAVLAAVLSLGALLRADDTVVLTDGTVLQGQVMQETSDQVVLMDHGTQRTLQRSLVAKVEFNTSPSSSDSASAPAADDASGGNTVPSAQGGPAGDNGAAPSDAGSPEGGNTVPSVQGGPDGGDTMPSAQGGPDAGPDGGNAAPAAPTQDEQDYASGVSAYYQIPPDQVWGFEEQGIPYEELPVVFYVASRAMVAPGLVVGLRLRGMPWADICMHFGLQPGIFYWRSLFAANLGGPYGGIYLTFRHYPHRRWRWGLIALSDADIINCVNLRFDTAYWHLRPYDVVRWRGLGHPFFWGGYGYHYARFHGRAGWGARGAWGARAGFGRQRGGRAGFNRQGGHGNHGQGGHGHGENGDDGNSNHNHN